MLHQLNFAHWFRPMAALSYHANYRRLLTVWNRYPLTMVSAIS